MTLKIAFAPCSVLWFAIAAGLAIALAVAERPVRVVRCSAAVYDEDLFVPGKTVLDKRSTNFRPLTSYDRMQVETIGYEALTYSAYTEQASIDYRDQLTPIKDQGFCGSCWAHAIVETVEWHLFNQSGKRVALSTMQLTACVGKGYATGCSGGFPIDVMSFYAQTGRPIVPASVYPYSPHLLLPPASINFDLSCIQCDINSSLFAPFTRSTLFDPSASITRWGGSQWNYTANPPNVPNTAVLSTMLVSHGPLVVVVDASGWGDYLGGLFPAANCSSDWQDLDHAVQLVGFTEEAWIVRNSYSANWGENGFIRLQRRDEDGTLLNTCGIAYEPVWLEVDVIQA